MHTQGAHLDWITRNPGKMEEHFPVGELYWNYWENENFGQFCTGKIDKILKKSFGYFSVRKRGNHGNRNLKYSQTRLIRHKNTYRLCNELTGVTN